MGDDGRNGLAEMLSEYGDVIELKLDSSTPADIEPLLVNLKPEFLPVSFKNRLYPLQKKKFIMRYLRHLLKLCLVKKVTAPECVSAPRIVPKRPPEMYCLTVDYRPVHSANLQTLWPMPNIEAELVDSRGEK